MNPLGYSSTSIYYALYLAGIMLMLNILYALFYQVKSCGVNIISNLKWRNWNLENYLPKVTEQLNGRDWKKKSAITRQKLITCVDSIIMMVISGGRVYPLVALGKNKKYRNEMW